MQKNSRAAFTLLELLLALSIMSIIMTVTYLTFTTGVNAWKRGAAMTENLHHGDYVMEQLIMGIRSAYYPDTKRAAPEYGFWHKNDGSYSEARDVISWVKVGTSLVGEDCPYAGSPHRVEFMVDKDDDENNVVFVKSWRLLGQPEEFDSEDLEPFVLSKKVVGFDCRAAYRIVNEEVEWLDEWESTNKLPTALELTLYLEPDEEGEDPTEIRRVIGIPVGQLCWD